MIIKRFLKKEKKGKKGTSTGCTMGCSILKMINGMGSFTTASMKSFKGTLKESLTKTLIGSLNWNFSRN